MSTVRGNPGPEEVGRELVWTPASGWRTEVIFEGERGTIEGLIPNLKEDADEIRIIPDGPTARLVASFNREANVGAAEVAETTWELIGNDVQKDLREHTRSLQLGEDTIRKVSGKAEEAIANPNTTITQYNTGLTGDALALFNFLVKGQNTYLDQGWVLRQSKYVSRKFEAKVGMTGIQKLWTTAQIVATEAIPAQILFDITQIVIPPIIPSGYSWAWLKKTPQVQQQAGNKFVMQQEWWLEVWNSSYFYDLHS